MWYSSNEFQWFWFGEFDKCCWLFEIDRIHFKLISFDKLSKKSTDWLFCLVSLCAHLVATIGTRLLAWEWLLCCRVAMCIVWPVITMHLPRALQPVYGTRSIYTVQMPRHNKIKSLFAMHQKLSQSGHSYMVFTMRPYKNRICSRWFVIDQFGRLLYNCKLKFRVCSWSCVNFSENREICENFLVSFFKPTHLGFADLGNNSVALLWYTQPRAFFRISSGIIKIV